MAEQNRTRLIPIDDRKRELTPGSDGHQPREGIIHDMEFDAGYISPFFITNAEKEIAELAEPYILMHEEKLSKSEQIWPLMSPILEFGRPLLIIGGGVERGALEFLVLNKRRSVLKVAAVRAPGSGEQLTALLEDIASLTGGLVVNDSLGVKLMDVTLDMLGTAKKVLIERKRTTIIGGGGRKTAPADTASIPSDVDGDQPVERTGGRHVVVPRRDIPRIDFGPTDAALFPEMEALIKGGQAGSPYAAGLALSDNAQGTGTVITKAKRLAHRYIQWKAEQG